MPLLFRFWNINLWFLEGWRNLQQLYITFFLQDIFGCNKSHLKEPFCRRKHLQCVSDINLKRENEIANIMHCPSTNVIEKKDPFLIYVRMLQLAIFFLLFFHWKLLFLINAQTMANNS